MRDSVFQRKCVLECYDNFGKDADCCVIAWDRGTSRSDFKFERQRNQKVCSRTGRPTYQPPLWYSDSYSPSDSQRMNRRKLLTIDPFSTTPGNANVRPNCVSSTPDPPSSTIIAIPPSPYNDKRCWLTKAAPKWPPISSSWPNARTTTNDFVMSFFVL